ncbi:other 1 protein kinase [Favolaschia claudopus]|uniref:Other 1 protein kinase n=1 Tax=Favolaschia claudopus TaxID=2862362 RepID=A0AAW0BPG3_9AGAR
MNTDSTSSGDFEDNLEEVPDWPFDSCTLELSDGRSLELADSISRLPTHKEPAVYMCRARLGMDDVVVKYSWSDARMHEAQVVETAASFARECGDVWVLDHLPNIVHYEERKSSEGARTEPATLHLLVQEELYPITELTTAAELGEAFSGFFKCYRWLVERARIMHRDISLSNLMYRTLDGKVHGVLDGFTLAVFMDGQSSSFPPQNAPPFRAIDFFQSVPPAGYLYRYDLESMFYALLLVSSSYQDGKRIPPSTKHLEKWDKLDPDTLFNEKWWFLTCADPGWRPTAQFSGLRNLIFFLACLFNNGIYARTKFCDQVFDDTGSRAVSYTDGFDLTTLGGHVTFDSFANVLSARLPPYSPRRTSAMLSSPASSLSPPTRTTKSNSLPTVDLSKSDTASGPWLP